MGTKRNVTITGANDNIKIIEASEEAQKIISQNKTAKQTATADKDDKKEEAAKKETVAKAKTQTKKARSKKYQAVRSQLDKTKRYSLAEAVALVKKLSYSNFTGTISAHLQVKEKGEKVTLSFPHNTGKTINVAIFNDKVLKQIEDGNLDFDVLLATPKDMSKITKHARLLGPKGLMPNPKNGTLTPNPELKKKELEAGKLTLKTEKKAPLMHVVIGKTDMEDQALVENLQTLLKALKGKVRKLSLAASMSPGVKVDVEEYKTKK